MLQAISHGWTNEQIAARMHVSLATVKTHVNHIYGKLHISDPLRFAPPATQETLLVHGTLGTPPFPFALRYRRAPCILNPSKDLRYRRARPDRARASFDTSGLVGRQPEGVEWRARDE
ncbi:response regulator transcription factor [Piscinibacter sp.]|uniref:response regulator transcription factor n=1 Tax=Piscinibacter sp. TaxID=1903157 RepID=UPI0035595F74